MVRQNSVQRNTKEDPMKHTWLRALSSIAVVAALLLPLVSPGPIASAQQDPPAAGVAPSVVDPVAPWEPADVERLRASWVDGHLSIAASGEKPTPCHDVAIVQLPIGISPTQFAVRWRQPRRCIEVITPYHVVESFPLSDKPDSITVYTSKGWQKVPVEEGR